MPRFVLRMRVSYLLECYVNVYYYAITEAITFRTNVFNGMTRIYLGDVHIYTVFVLI